MSRRRSDTLIPAALYMIDNVLSSKPGTVVVGRRPARSSRKAIQFANVWRSPILRPRGNLIRASGLARSRHSSAHTFTSTTASPSASRLCCNLLGALSWPIVPDSRAWTYPSRSASATTFLAECTAVSSSTRRPSRFFCDDDVGARRLTHRGRCQGLAFERLVFRRRVGEHRDQLVSGGGQQPAQIRQVHAKYHLGTVRGGSDWTRHARILLTP